MEELFALKDFYALFEGDSKPFVMIGVMIIAFYPMLLIMRKLVNPALSKLVIIQNPKYAEIMDRHGFRSYIIHVFICIYLFFWSEVFDQAELTGKSFIYYKDKVLAIYATILVAYVINGLISLFVDIYKSNATPNRVPIGLHAHILKIIISIGAFFIVLSHALNLNIGTLFTSIGAAAALLTFVFKDTVLGLLASLQLTFQDIIKVGDWITVPAYNADGNIELITITVVKVRNFDNTVSTVPTHALLTTSVQNWRAMSESGGRRIKRSVNIDIDTIKICDQKELNKYLKISNCSKLAKDHPELFKAENRVTNITIFRHYISKYLDEHESIHSNGFTFLIRQLQSTETGVPIEIYVFTNTTDWVIYENIQAEIFDHIFGILPEFELKAFQSLVHRVITTNK